MRQSVNPTSMPPTPAPGENEPVRPGLRLTRRRIRKSAAVLPTLFTLGNALSGFMAIFFASRPPTAELPWGWTPITFAALCIFLGMVFDALDGRIARLTRQTSDLGEQLDSMADMVTFGVAPAFIAVQLVLGDDTPYFASNQADTFFGRIALVVACIYVSCTALRLARFNIETRSPQLEDHLYFKGLPSPGAAGTVASMILLHQHFLADITRNHSALGSSDVLFGSATDVPMSLRLAAIGMVAVMLLTALAMVSRWRYVHAANRYLRGRAKVATIAKLVISALLLAVWPQPALAAGFVIYALSAPMMSLWSRLFPKPAGNSPHA